MEIYVIISIKSLHVIDINFYYLLNSFSRCKKKSVQLTMSESEEDSSNSENNWPMHEDWMLDILKDDDKSEAKVKINVMLNHMDKSN